MHFNKFAVQIYHAAQPCTLIQSNCVFIKGGKIPRNSISGNTLYFYVEKIVFSPQRGKMSFNVWYNWENTTFICSFVINSVQ